MRGDLEGTCGCDTATNVPLARWSMEAIQTRRFNVDARLRVRYGSFVQSDFALFDSTFFRILPGEAAALEP